MRDGVTMRDPSTVYLDWDVTLAPDVTLEPNVILRGATSVGEGSVIGAGSQIVDSTIGARASVWASDRRVVDGRGRGHGRAVQPPAAGQRRRRGAPRSATTPSSRTRASARGSKQHHMSYLGDAEIGEGVNIGAGHDHRQLRRHAQAPHDDRRRRVHRRRHDDRRAARDRRGRPDRRRRRRHEGRAGGQARGRACRPGSASPAEPATRVRPDTAAGAGTSVPSDAQPMTRHRRAPRHRAPDPPRGRSSSRPRSPSSRSAAAGSSSWSTRATGAPAASSACIDEPGPVPGGHPDRPDVHRVLRLGVRRGQPADEPRRICCAGSASARGAAAGASR